MNIKTTETRCWDTRPSYAVEAVKRVEAKLTQLQAQLAELSAQGSDTAYMLGFAEGGIKAVLTEISVWGEA